MFSSLAGNVTTADSVISDPHFLTVFHNPRSKAKYRQVLFHARVMFLKKLHNSNIKLSFQTVHFLEVRGLTTASYISYDYATSGHMDLYGIQI